MDCEYRILQNHDEGRLNDRFRVQYRKWYQFRWHDIRFVTHVGPETCSTGLHWHDTLEEARKWVIRRTTHPESRDSYNTRVVETYL